MIPLDLFTEDDGGAAARIFAELRVALLESAGIEPARCSALMTMTMESGKSIGRPDRLRGFLVAIAGEDDPVAEVLVRRTKRGLSVVLLGVDWARVAAPVRRKLAGRRDLRLTLACEAAFANIDGRWSSVRVGGGS